MLRTLARSLAFARPAFVFSIFHHRNENDYDYLNTQASKPPETGWERVKNMYSLNEMDEISIELHTVIQSTFGGSILGACLGGFVHSKNAYIYFIENNQATIFQSTRQAQKKLQDYVTVAFCKGACQWGWRLAIFTGIFTTITTTLSVYNGNTSLIEYIAAGTITGAMYKVNLGFAATLVGAALGAILSSIGGMAILGLLKVTGVTMDDIRKALYSIKTAREEQMRQATEKACNELNDPLLKHHKEIVKERGEKPFDQM